ATTGAEGEVDTLGREIRQRDSVERGNGRASRRGDAHGHRTVEQLYRRMVPLFVIEIKGRYKLSYIHTHEFERQKVIARLARVLKSVQLQRQEVERRPFRSEERAEAMPG